MGNVNLTKYFIFHSTMIIFIKDMTQKKFAIVKIEFRSYQMDVRIFDENETSKNSLCSSFRIISMPKYFLFYLVYIYIRMIRKRRKGLI